jgi:hypothetical protein
MDNSNEILARTIVEKLKTEGLISTEDTQLVLKLAKGLLKEADWKVAFEEVINKPDEGNETK